MKKGQKVRILRTNETGTVANQELIRKGGQVKRYIKVKLDHCPKLDTWYMEDELGSVQEQVKAEFTDERGRVLVLDFVYDHHKKALGTITMTGRNPENLKNHIRGFHSRLVGVLMTALGATGPNVESRADSPSVQPD